MFKLIESRLEMIAQTAEHDEVRMYIGAFEVPLLYSFTSYSHTLDVELRDDGCGDVALDFICSLHDRKESLFDSRIDYPDGSMVCFTARITGFEPSGLGFSLEIFNKKWVK